MAYSPITPAEISVGRPITQGLWDKVRRNFDDHQMRLTIVAGGGQVPNGSFEIEAGTTGVPVSWHRHGYPGGVLAFDFDSVAHGARSYRFVHPGGVGNGGGMLESELIETDHLVRKMLHFILWSSVTGIRNLVIIQFFNRARVFLSETIIYDSTANPVVPTYFIRIFTPPVGTRFLRILLIGGHTSVNVAGTTWFDGVSFGSMPHWRVRGRDFTLAEHTTGSTTWVDAGIAHLPLEFNSNIQIIDLRFSAILRTMAGITGFQRFRIGTTFSNEVSIVSNVNTWHEFHFPLVPIAHSTASHLSIVQQLATSHAGQAVTGSKPPDPPDRPTSFEYISS